MVVIPRERSSSKVASRTVVMVSVPPFGRLPEGILPLPGILRSMGPTDRETRDFLRRLLVLGIVLAALLVGGTIGYSRTLHWNAWDSFDLALGTIATLGAHTPNHRAGAEIVEVML